MNQDEILNYLKTTFAGIDVQEANGDYFVFYYPGGDAPQDNRFPFVTIVNSDFNDPYSDLNRPNVFRLNIGIGKETHRRLFGEPPASDEAQWYEPLPGYDYTVLDKVIPHPVYHKMHWVSILNPGAETFKTEVAPLLTEAYDLAVSQYSKRHKSEA